MPPRTVAPLVARAKAAPLKAPLPPPSRVYEQPVKQEQTTCPLCIEELDSTDLQFLPCPCGYRVCLFCYGKIKEMCHSLCPGCRREYGEAQHLPDSQESSTTAAVTVRATQAQNGQVHAMGLAAAQAGAPRLPPRVIAPPAPPPPRRPDAAAGKRPEEPGTSFRGPATWANLAPRVANEPASDRSQPSQLSSSQAMSDAAWPDLSAAVPSAQPPPPRPSRSTQDDNNHQRSTSVMSMEHTPSVVNIEDMMSQDPVVQFSSNFTEGGSSGLDAALTRSTQPNQTAQVATSVLGSMRPIHVALASAGSQQEAPLPEAKAQLLQHVHDVRSGALSSQAAGQQLLSLLGQRPATSLNPMASLPNGNARLPMHLKAPPPGFGVPAQSHVVPYQPINPMSFNALLSPLLDTPITSMGTTGVLQPIGTKSQKPLQLPPHLQILQQPPQPVQQSLPQPERVYSLWSGFQGLQADLRPPPYDPYKQQQAQQQWQPPGFSQQQYPQNGLLGHGYPQTSFSHHPPIIQPQSVKPPPGFGGPPQLHGMGSLGQSEQGPDEGVRFTSGLSPNISHMATGFGGGHLGVSLLSAARAPPPGMNGQFRPAQLGAPS